jgi:hypothetical protein
VLFGPPPSARKHHHLWRQRLKQVLPIGHATRGVAVMAPVSQSSGRVRSNRALLLGLAAVSVVGGAVAMHALVGGWWIGAIAGLLPIANLLLPSQREVAWRKGAEGERAVARAIDQLASTRALHDRRIPGSRANIDNILIAPTGGLDGRREELHRRARDSPSRSGTVDRGPGPVETARAGSTADRRRCRRPRCRRLARCPGSANAVFPWRGVAAAVHTAAC